MSKKIMFLLFFLLQIILLSNCSKGDAIDRIEDTLEISISDIVMIIVSCGVIVTCAFDARIALMIAFLLYTSVFIVFTEATANGYTGFNPYFSGLAMMICFVILALSLLITYKKASTPPYSIV